MSRQKTLNIAVDQTTNELVGYWAPQSGLNGIVVRAGNEKLLQLKFERALRHYDKKEEQIKSVLGDKTRIPAKLLKQQSVSRVRVKSKR